MKRPEVVIHLFTSVDGRITTAPGRNVLEWVAHELDGEAFRESLHLMNQFNYDGEMSGSETLMVWGDHYVEMTEPLPESDKPRAYIVFDGQGRINWMQSDGLIVVTKQDVCQNYIDQLRSKGIDFIQAGSGKHIDLPLALNKLYQKGFRRLALTGGGTINGAFLHEGLVDKINVVIAPLAVGGKNTPTLFDCPDLGSMEGLTRLELLETSPVGNGAVWLHYKIGR